jgi:hypothetical protein
LQIKIATVAEFEGMDAVCSVRKKKYGLIDPIVRAAKNTPV